jgi:DNA-binding GntR family transcriptional regulator
VTPAAASKQEATHEILKARIVDGQYGPGHRLVIDAIARELKISPMPVREAIRRLEAEGWVVYERNLGARVAPLDADSWREAVEILAVLEGHATARAAPLLNVEDIAAMRAHNERLLQALEDFDVIEFSQINLAFHDVVHARCPNLHLQRELRSIQERVNTLRSSIFMYIPRRGKTAIEEHDRLIELIAAGADPLEIEIVARDHKLHTILAFDERMTRDKPDAE